MTNGNTVLPAKDLKKRLDMYSISLSKMVVVNGLNVFVTKGNFTIQPCPSSEPI